MTVITSTAPPQTQLNRALWGIVGAFAITTLASVDVALSWLYLARWLVAMSFWAFAAVASAYHPRFLLHFYLLAFGGSLGVSVVADMGGRAAGWAGGPNIAAFLLAIATILACQWWGRAEVRPFLAVAGLVLVAGLTQSRSGTAALVLGLATAEFMRHRGQAGHMATAAVWGLATLAALQWQISAMRPELATLANETAGIYYRWDFWAVAWDSFLSRPIVGLGPNTYQLAWRAAVPGSPFYSAHNWPLHLAAEQGLVGLGAWAWGGWVVARACWASWTASPVQIALCGVWAAVLVHILFDTPEWDVAAVVGAVLVHWGVADA